MAMVTRPAARSLAMDRTAAISGRCETHGRREILPLSFKNRAKKTNQDRHLSPGLSLRPGFPPTTGGLLVSQTLASTPSTFKRRMMVSDAQNHRRVDTAVLHWYCHRMPRTLSPPKICSMPQEPPRCPSLLPLHPLPPRRPLPSSTRQSDPPSSPVLLAPPTSHPSLTTHPATRLTHLADPHVVWGRRITIQHLLARNAPHLQRELCCLTVCILSTTRSPAMLKSRTTPNRERRTSGSVIDFPEICEMLGMCEN